MTGAISASSGSDEVRAHLRDWERDGFVVMRSVFDSETVEQCRAHLGSVQARLPLGFPIGAVPLGADDFVDRLTDDERLTGPASLLLGGPVRCFGFTYLVKEPRVGPPALWHQDGHPWQTQFGIDEALTLWIALDDVRLENGGLLVLPGTHSQPAQPLADLGGVGGGDRDGAGGSDEGMFGGGMFGGGIDPGPVEAGAVRPLEMAPGDVSAHHSNLIHSSGPNRTDQARRAAAVRFRQA